MYLLGMFPYSISILFFFALYTTMDGHLLGLDMEGWASRNAMIYWLSMACMGIFFFPWGISSVFGAFVLPQGWKAAVAAF